MADLNDPTLVTGIARSAGLPGDRERMADLVGGCQDLQAVLARLYAVETGDHEPLFAPEEGPG